MKRVIALAAIALLILSGGIAIGQGVLKSVPFDFTVAVRPAVKTIEVYVDPEGTTPLTAIHFGQRYQGDNATFDMWVKNTGNTAFNVVPSVNGDITAWGTGTFFPVSFTLTPGDITKVTFTLAVSSNATLGAGSATIDFIEGP